MHDTIDTAVAAGKFKTLGAAGALLRISTTGGVKLNAEINVVKTDIVCTNGVIQVIDSVLLPSA